MTREAEITEIVNRETRAWDTQDADLLVSCFHPAMVWPWPPTAQSHDPLTWVMVLGRFNADRWKRSWQALFDSHDLMRNAREIRKVVVGVRRRGHRHAVATQGDGRGAALAGADLQDLHAGRDAMEDDRANGSARLRSDGRTVGLTDGRWYRGHGPTIRPSDCPTITAARRSPLLAAPMARTVHPSSARRSRTRPPVSTARTRSPRPPRPSRDR